jgi:hypothetical protein
VIVLPLGALAFLLLNLDYFLLVLDVLVIAVR